MIWLLPWLVGVAAAGWMALSLAARRPVPRVDRAIAAVPVGLLLTTIALFTANWLFRVPVSRWSVLALTALMDGMALLPLIVAGRRAKRDPLAERPLGAHPPWWQKIDALSRASLILAALLLLSWLGFVLWLTLSGPLQGWDFYAYHWHYTRLIVESGNLPSHAGPTLVDSPYAYPPLVFVIYAQVSVVAGGLSQLGPRLLPLLFTVGTVFIALRIARVCLALSWPAALVAAAFTLWKGDFYNAAVLQENTDMGGVFFTVAAAYWLIRRDIAPSSRAVATALFLAGAYWTRYNGLALFMIVAAMQFGALIWRSGVFDRHPRASLAWLSQDRELRRELLLAIGTLALGAALISPHLLRNLALWGNPIYPAFARFIGGYLIDPWVLQHVVPYWTPAPFVRLPTDWWQHPLSTLSASAPALTFVIVALCPAIARLRKGHPEALLLWLGAALYFVCYLLFMRVPDDGDSERHLLPMIALGAPLVGLVFETITTRSLLGLATAGGAFLLIGWFLMSNLAWQWTTVNAVLLLVMGMVVLVTWAPIVGPRMHGRPRLDLLYVFALPFIVVLLANRLPTDPLVENGLQRLPESAILRGMPATSRYLTFDNRVELLGGHPISGDDPSLEHFYQAQLSGTDGVNELKRLGIAEIYWSIPSASSHYPRNPLATGSPLWSQLDDPALFDRIFQRQDPSGSVAIYVLR